MANEDNFMSFLRTNWQIIVYAVMTLVLSVTLHNSVTANTEWISRKGQPHLEGYKDEIDKIIAKEIKRERELFDEKLKTIKEMNQAILNKLDKIENRLK